MSSHPIEPSTNSPDAGASGPGDAQLLTVGEVALLLNCGKRTVHRLADSGKMPPPVRIGGLVRWRADELRQWIADGCPSVRSVKGGRR